MGRWVMPGYHSMSVMFVINLSGIRNLGINDRDGSGYVVYTHCLYSRYSRKRVKTFNLDALPFTLNIAHAV